MDIKIHWEASHLIVTTSLTGKRIAILLEALGKARRDRIAAIMGIFSIKAIKLLGLIKIIEPLKLQSKMVGIAKERLIFIPFIKEN